MAYRPVPACPVRLDHGRRQLAELSPLAEMARHSEAGPLRGGRSPRTQPLRRRQRRGPSALRRPHSGIQRFRPALLQTTGLDLLARTQIGAFVHRVARLTAAWRNFPWCKGEQQEWKEPSEIAILMMSPVLTGASA